MIETSAKQQGLLQMQLEALLRQVPAASVAGPMASIVLAIGLWRLNSPLLILGWLVLITSIYLTRLYYFRQLRANPLRLDHPAPILRNLTWMNLTTSLCWCLASAFYDLSWPTGLQVILWLVIMGVAASTINSYAFHLPSFLAFTLPLWISAYVFLVFRPPHPDLDRWILGFMLFFYGLVVINSGLRFNRTIQENFRSQLHLESLNRRLQQQADHDPLTRLLNRRGFDRQIKTEWARHIREKRCLAALMIDIDYFKRYNDRYGHDAGDHCIQRIAEALHSVAQRPGDLVARYGGEEFLILLTHANREQALVVAERLRERVERLAIPHENNPDQPIVTISIGVASLEPSANEDETSLYLNADKELYKAKAAGRNRVSG